MHSEARRPPRRGRDPVLHRRHTPRPCLPPRQVHRALRRQEQERPGMAGRARQGRGPRVCAADHWGRRYGAAYRGHADVHGARGGARRGAGGAGRHMGARVHGHRNGQRAASLAGRRRPGRRLAPHRLHDGRPEVPRVVVGGGQGLPRQVFEEGRERAVDGGSVTAAPVPGEAESTEPLHGNRFESGKGLSEEHTGAELMGLRSR